MGPRVFIARALIRLHSLIQILGSGSHIPTHQKLKGVRIPEPHAKFQGVVYLSTLPVSTEKHIALLCRSAWEIVKLKAMGQDQEGLCYVCIRE